MASPLNISIYEYKQLRFHNQSHGRNIAANQQIIPQYFGDFFQNQATLEPEKNDSKLITSQIS